MHTAAIGVGSNLGDRAGHLQSAALALASLPSSRLIAVSRAIETEPVGPVAQGPFLNAAALIETDLPPRELLAHLHRIERDHGRDRATGERWGPRTLDLDLLVYGEVVIDEGGLTLPHPRMHERRFVLEPLAAIAPELRVAGKGRTVAQLLAAL